MTTTPADGTVRPFAAWLAEQNNGALHTELSDGLRDLVAAVLDTGKKGSITLTVKVEPMKDTADVLIVHDDVKLNLPEHPRKGAVYYATDDHNLVRDDPHQPVITGLREVGRDATVDPALLREAGR